MPPQLFASLCTASPFSLLRDCCCYSYSSSNKVVNVSYFDICSSPEAGLVRLQQQKSKRECEPELHLHRQAPGHHVTTRRWQLVVSKENVMHHRVLANVCVEYSKRPKEGQSADKEGKVRREDPWGGRVHSQSLNCARAGDMFRAR